MNRPKITIVLEKNGDVRSTNVNGAGSNCLDVTKDIEQALGIVDEKSRQITAEMYETVDPLRVENQVEA